MAKSLSEDLRSRLIAAVDGGMSRRGAAEGFGVAVATSIRWVSAWRHDGSVCSKPRGGDLGSHRIEAYRAIVLAAIDAQVDITLTELADMLRQQHGVNKRGKGALTHSRCRTGKFGWHDLALLANFGSEC